ncbi:MAG: MFS transporter [Holophagaceae bacterium]|nr:MFS transporter [Holophagaceae bacterium]
MDTPRPRLFTPAFVLLTSFYFLIFAAGYQLFPVLPLRWREMGATLAESGHFMAAFTLGSGLGALFTGPLGDRLGQRRVLRGASLFCAACFGAYAVMPGRWGFYVLAPLHGLLWSGLRTASVAKVGGLLPDEARAEGLSIFGLASPGGVAVGPLVGLWLFPHLGFHWHMALLGLAFLGLHVMVGRLPKDLPKAERPPLHLGPPERRVWLPAAILFLLALSYGPMPPYSAQEAKALGLAWPSALLTCFALGMVAMRFALGMRGLGAEPGRLVPWMMGITFVGNLLLAVLPGGTFLGLNLELTRHIAGALIYGAGYGMVHTLIFSEVMSRGAADRRGAAVGALYAAFDGGVAAGSVGLGWIMQRYSFRIGWAVGAACLVVAWGLCVRLARNGDPKRTEAVRA